MGSEKPGKGPAGIEIPIGDKGYGAKMWGSRESTTKATEFNKEFNARTSITFGSDGKVVDHHGKYQGLGITIDLLKDKISGLR